MKNITKKSYSPAFKTMVVKEMLGQEKTISQICSEYKNHPTQAHKWKKKAVAQMQEGFKNPLEKDSRAAEQEELISDLYNKIGKLTVELEWLKKSSKLSPSEKLEAIDPDHKITINRQCDLLGLTRSTYYYKPAGESEYNIMLMNIIDKIYTKCPFYGYPRITHKLRREGHDVNHKRIHRLMALMGIQGVCPRKNTSYNSCKNKKYPYLLKGLNISYPNQVWGTDITYIRMRKGFMYLVAIMDWYSRYIVSWVLSNSLSVEFCLELLDKAFKIAKPEINNTDQGSQFTAEEYVEKVESANVKVSMDGRGRVFDNIFT